MPRTDLSAFAAELAARLPGPWTSEYHRHPAYEDQFPRANQLWDMGHVGWAVDNFVLSHDAILTTPVGDSLYLIDRPLHPRQFLIAPLEPDGFKPHQIAPVNAPNGIAVPDDPVRAAALVTRRFLPRYDHAREAVFRNALMQPEPPRRPAPPEVSKTVTLTWYDDGALGSPHALVPEEARTALYVHYFQYDPHQAAFILPASYGRNGQATLVQSVTRSLAARGIGVNLRHTPPATGPGLPPPMPKATHGPHR